MKTHRGFTLIELLVVIAVIGIIASVILASLSTARLKGADALVKTNLSSLSSQAEIVRDETGDYFLVCSDSKVINSLQTAALKSKGDANDYRCAGLSATWVASVPLAQQNQVGPSSGEDYWCTQSTGGGKLIDTQVAVDATTCG